MDASPARPPARRGLRTLLAAAALVPVVVIGTAACTGPPPPEPSSPPPSSPEQAQQAADIVAIVEEAMVTLDLKAVIVQVQVGDEVVITQAFGESMTGVPATTDMHFRNGAVAFSYVSNLLLQYVDDGTVSLDDTIDQWMPDLPEADKVTLLMLTNQTTGYPDFETDPGWTAAYNADPFHEFTFDERIDYAFSRPLQFEPGTNWSYAHTNFMILGHILSEIGGKPLDELLKEKVLDPMGLTETAAYDSSFIPEPVLHAFSSERRAALQLDPSEAFYEESSFWNAVWGTPIGGAQTTTISDMTKTAIAVGTGALLSDESFHAMTDSKLIGFGEAASGMRAVLLHAGRGLQLRSRGGAFRGVDAAESAAERLQRHRGIPAVAEDRDLGREHVRTGGLRLQRDLRQLERSGLQVDRHVSRPG